MSDLEKQVAIVTGGGTGIGRAVALALAEAGVKVVVCGRRLKPLEQTVQEINLLGSEGLAIQRPAASRTRSPRSFMAWMSSTVKRAWPPVWKKRASRNS